MNNAVGKELIEQMEKLGPHATPLVACEKAEAAAALVIARKLRTTESMSIGEVGIPYAEIARLAGVVKRANAW